MENELSTNRKIFGKLHMLSEVKAQEIITVGRFLVA